MSFDGEMPRLTRGRLLEGEVNRYAAIGVIGESEFAEVIAARETGTPGVDSWVAIKRPQRELLPTREEAAAFLARVYRVSRAKHDNVLAITDAGMADDGAYIVMPWLHGETLRAMLATLEALGRLMRPELAAFIAAAVCDALEFAHLTRDGGYGDEPLLHGNLRPQNVMLTFAGAIKVLDLGLDPALKIDRRVHAKNPAQVAYLSPERARGDGPSHQADLFSLGVILWEATTGKALFRGRDVRTTLQAVRECRVPNLREINPDTQPDFAAIVARALAKEPLERYPSAYELGRDLRRYLAAHQSTLSPSELGRLMRQSFPESVQDESPQAKVIRAVTPRSVSWTPEVEPPPDNVRVDERITNPLAPLQGEGAETALAFEDDPFQSSYSGDGALPSGATPLPPPAPPETSRLPSQVARPRTPSMMRTPSLGTPAPLSFSPLPAPPVATPSPVPYANPLDRAPSSLGPVDQSDPRGFSPPVPSGLPLLTYGAPDDGEMYLPPPGSIDPNRALVPFRSGGSLVPSSWPSANGGSYGSPLPPPRFVSGGPFEAPFSAPPPFGAEPRVESEPSPPRLFDTLRSLGRSRPLLSGLLLLIAALLVVIAVELLTHDDATLSAAAPPVGEAVPLVLPEQQIRSAAETAPASNEPPLAAPAEAPPTRAEPAAAAAAEPAPAPAPAPAAAPAPPTVVTAPPAKKATPPAAARTPARAPAPSAAAPSPPRPAAPSPAEAAPAEAADDDSIEDPFTAVAKEAQEDPEDEDEKRSNQLLADAMAAMRKGDRIAAESSLRGCAKLALLAECHRELAKLLVSTGDNWGAASQYRKYLRLLPDAEDAVEIEKKIFELER